MKDVSIRDYIGYSKELTAEQVRKLTPGSVVRMHSLDRYGAHQYLDMTVVQSGKKKVLVATSFYGDRVERPIRTATDRMCYTEVKHDD